MNKTSKIYISGLYRSGTTLLCDILDGHSKIDITYGTVHFMRYSFDKYNPIEKNYKTLVKDTFNRIKNKWDLHKDYASLIEIIEKQNNISYSSIYDNIMRDFLGSNYIWGEKTNNGWEYIQPFTDLFPDGKVIHIIRDPRAVLASFKYFTFHPKPMYLDAIFAASAMFNYIQQPSIVGNNQVLIIKYEDLVTEPSKILNDICSHLGVELEPNMLENNTNNKSKKTYSANSSFVDNLNSINPNRINTWKEKLTNIDIFFNQEILYHYIKKFGYELIDLKLNNLEKSEFENLLNHNYIKPRYNYWKKYGTGIQSFPENGEKYLEG